MRRLLFTLFLSAAVVLFLVAANWTSIHEYFTLPYIAGWDGMAHQLVGEYYSNHIFPSVWGWIPYWYAGMPFPQFYPPLFYFLMALIDHVFFFVEYLLLFKIFIAVLLAAVPLLSMHLVKTWTGRRSIGFFAGCLSVLLMSVNVEDHYYGVSITSTIAVGMVTQLLGYVAFLLWLKYIFKIGEGRFNFIFAGIALACIMLSNAHIVVFAGICILTFGAIEVLVQIKHGKKNVAAYVKKYIAHLLIGGCLASVWYIPLLVYYSYFAGISLPESYEASFYLNHFWYLHFIIVAAGVVAWKKKDRVFMHISAMLLLTDAVIILFSMTDRFAFFLPVHVTRFIAPHLFMSVFSISYLLFVSVQRYRRIVGWWIMSTALLVITLVLTYQTSIFSPSITGVYHHFESDKVEEISDFLARRPTLTVVEVDLLNSEPRSFVLDSWIGKKEGMTIFSNLRESSISSIFLGPARNIISSDWELWGTVSYIANDQLFINPNLRTALDRLRFLGVNNIVSLTKDMQSWLSESSRLKSELFIAHTEIFSFKETVAQAEILKYEPVLLFVPTYFRERAMDSPDYVRFQEELFNQNTFDIIGVRAEAKYLDDADELQKFKFAIISDYSYKNEDQAYQALISYVEKGGRLLLLESKDPLYERLKDASKAYRSIQTFKKYVTDQGTYPFRNAISYLKQYKIPVESQGAIELKESENRKEIMLKENTAREYPILVKRSYFPAWKRQDGNKIYLASPTYMFTYATSSFSVEFKKTWPVYMGQTIFFGSIGLGILFVLVTLYYKKRPDR